jgi:hypothetical protein
MSDITGNVSNTKQLVGRISNGSQLRGGISGASSMAGGVIPRGNDGISPTIDVKAVEGGHEITITDIRGTTTFVIKDGVVGDNTVSKVTVVSVTLLASAWVGSGNLYSQVVEIEGVTERTQVDLTPSAAQLLAFYEKNVTFSTANRGGEVTVYAIGEKPTSDYTIQANLTEVNV